MANLRMKKAELVARLEEQKALAEAIDKAAEVAHRQAEQAWLKDMRALMRDLSKVSDYREMVDRLAPLSKYGSRDFGSTLPRPPTCPLRQARDFERALEQLKLDNRTVWNITERGNTEGLHRLVTHSFENHPRTVCD